ncbi:MAG: stalk domain-containing protein [Caldisericia bacterium]
MIDNPVAKINGKDVKIIGADGKTQLYPTIVNDRTMLPLRFAVESVGADVNWVADEQAIEIVYPSDTVED